MRDYHAYRQCQTASMARNYVRHGMQFLSPELDTEGPPQRAATEFPIYSFLLALLYQTLGVRDVWGRLLSMAFAAWGVLFFHSFVRRRFGESTGFWSAMVLSCLPVYIYFTRTVQPEPMALWGLLGFLYFTDLWLFERPRPIRWLLACALGAIGPLLKLPFFYLIVPLWFGLGYERGQWKAVFRPAYIALLAGIGTLTFAWYHYAKTAPIGLLPLTSQEHLENLRAVLTLNLWKSQFVSRFPELVFTYSGLALALWGAVNARRAKSFGLLAFWSVAGVVYVLLLGRYGLIHRYTLLPLTPLAALWIGCGVSAAQAKAMSRPGVRVLLWVLLIGIPVHAGLRIKHWYRIEYGYLADAKVTLDAQGTPNDLVLVMTHEKPQHLYYLDRYGYALEPEQWTPADLDGMRAKSVRWVLVPVADNRSRLEDWTQAMKSRGSLARETSEYRLYRMLEPAGPARHG